MANKLNESEMHVLEKIEATIVDCNFQEAIGHKDTYIQELQNDNPSLADKLNRMSEMDWQEITEELSTLWINKHQ